MRLLRAHAPGVLVGVGFCVAGVDLGLRFLAGLIIVSIARDWAENAAYRRGWDDGVTKSREMVMGWLDKRTGRRPT